MVAMCLFASVIGSAAAAEPGDGRDLHRHAGDRVDLSDVRPVSRRSNSVDAANSSPAGLVETASTIEARRDFRQVALFDPAGCDASCGFEPTCGCDTVCDCPIGFSAEPACGVEPGCGIEPGCGCGAVGCDTFGCEGCCDGMDAGCGCPTCSASAASFIDGMFPRLGIQWRQLELFAGVAGFTGPLNFADIDAAGAVRRGAGSFGFYEGFNKGESLGFFGTDLSAQFGVRFVQANLSGAGFTNDTRQQSFVTSGLFRSVDYGFQYGVVFDYLYDDWYFRGNVSQLRGELSWVTRRSHVVGFKFAAGVDDDTTSTSVIDDAGAIASNQLSFEAINQYHIFYRQRLARYGTWEAFLGGSDNEETIIGMDLDLPVHSHLLFNTSANYLIPNEDVTANAEFEEGWNIAIGFTYRPCGLGAQRRHSRPLLKVADNGTLRLGRQ